jgi:hypothetical protein
MDFGPANPSMIPFFGIVSVGTMYARGLIAVFAIQALALTIYLIRRMRRELHLLDELTKVHRLRDAASGEARDQLPHQKENVWPH